MHMIITYPWVIVCYIAHPHVAFESYEYDDCVALKDMYCESARKAKNDDIFSKHPERYYVIISKQEWLRIQRRPFAGQRAKLHELNQNNKKIII